MLPHAQDPIAKITDQANRSYSVVESDSPALLVLNEWFTRAWKSAGQWQSATGPARKPVANWRTPAC
jgi:hypothetical protein